MGITSIDDYAFYENPLNNVYLKIVEGFQYAVLVNNKLTAISSGSVKVVAEYKHFVSNTLTIEIIEDSQNLDGDIETEFLINVQGFVCGVECHTWIDSSRGVVNQTLERFLPKMTYEPKTTEYPFGLTRIFLSRYEY